MIPLNVLLAAWSLNTLYLLVEYMHGTILLKTRQLEALSLYLLSFTCMLIAVNLYDYQKDRGDSEYRASAVLVTIGAILLFMGLHISVTEAVETMIVRKGSSRPIPVFLSPGGVEPDLGKAHRYNILIGEFDTPDSVDDEYGQVNHNFTDSCLLYHAMIFARLLDKVLLMIGVDILGCTDENKSRRDKGVCNCCESCIFTNTLCACVCCGGLELIKWDHDELSVRALGSEEETRPMMSSEARE